MVLFSEDHWKAQRDLPISRLTRTIIIGDLSHCLSPEDEPRFLVYQYPSQPSENEECLLNQRVPSWRDVSSLFSSVTAAVAVAVAVLLGRGNLFTSLDSVPATVEKGNVILMENCF